MKRLILSDLHIGSRNSNESALLDFLSENDCDELILAGDIIDFIRIPSFTNKSYHLFNIIENFQGDIIYIVGNHDISFRGLVGKSAFGVQFVDKYEFIDGPRKYRVEHGDKYETGIVQWKFLMKIISIFQEFLERWLETDLGDWKQKLLSNKRKLRRIWDIIEWNEDADVFIMGHTHLPEVLIWVDENEQIKTYANTGDWVQHQTYITVEDNVLRLKNWKNKETNF